MFKGIKQDIDNIKKNDPAARNSLEVILLYSGFHAILLHRPAHWLYEHNWFFLARFISQFARFMTGIEIHPGAKIGRGVLIDHGCGVVIGETAEVGDRCLIYQGVTLGGTGKDTGKRHPTLGEDVVVGAGAKVLGPFKVGNRAKIASNAVVLKEIPEDATAVGVPARVVSVKGARVDELLDHANIPDPLESECVLLREKINALEEKIEKMAKGV